MSEVKYELVDTEGLAECLATDAWKEETKNYPDDELHETLVLPGGETKKQVKPHWATTFFNLKTAFQKLIHEFIKHDV